MHLSFAARSQSILPTTSAAGIPVSIVREIIMTISVSRPANGSNTNTPFAGKIMSARNAAGYTVDQLALTCGLTSQEITALEAGTDGDPVRIKRVANALQIPITTLM